MNIRIRRQAPLAAVELTVHRSVDGGVGYRVGRDLNPLDDSQVTA